MDEQRALEFLDQQLDAAFGNVSAPPRLVANVLASVQKPRRLPELLDAIGVLALVATAAILLVVLVPEVAAGIVFALVSIAALGGAFAYAALVLLRT